MTKRYWNGTNPTTCQLCDDFVEDEFYDAFVPRFRQWGIVCHRCATRSGIRVGVGVGQRYKREGDRFVKIEG